MEGNEKIDRERERLRGKEKYRELRKGQGREVEDGGKRKVRYIGKGNSGKGKVENR